MLKNHKYQITNNKQYPMTKNTNSKHNGTTEYTDSLVSDIGILNLLFIWNLVLVYWCFVLN
jgi:hypothetical protein